MMRNDLAGFTYEATLPKLQFKTENFNTVISVLPDGTINLPRIGALKVWGYTIDQAEKEIKERYKAILRNPIIQYFIQHIRCPHEV